MYMYTFHILHCIFVCMCNIMTLLNVTNNIMLIFLYLHRLSVRQSSLYCNSYCLIFIHFVFTARHICVCKRTLYFSSTHSFFSLYNVTMLSVRYLQLIVLNYLLLFCRCATLYLSSRSSHCISFLLCIYFNKFKTKPVKIMGKNIKSYATTQVHSPGKGREALWQKVQIFRLKYGTA